MSEKALWANVKKHLGPYGHLVRVENTVERGTPDVNGCIQGREFWIELKHMDEWTRSAVFVIPHYTLNQRLWLRTRGLAGGRAFLLLRVGVEYMLFSWQDAFAHVGRVSPEELRRLALLRFVGNFNVADMLRNLMQ